MLSLGKMHSRAKSRSCENYLSIKVQVFPLTLWKSPCFPFVRMECKPGVEAVSGCVVCVVLHIRGMDVLSQLVDR